MIKYNIYTFEGVGVKPASVSATTKFLLKNTENAVMLIVIQEKQLG